MGASSSVVKRDDDASAGKKGGDSQKKQDTPFKRRMRQTQSFYVKEKTTGKAALMASLFNKSNDAMTKQTKNFLSEAINEFIFANASHGRGDNSELRTVLMVRALEREEFAKGDLIVSQGAHGDKLYVMESGGVDVLMGGYVISNLGPGSVFGELALLCDAPRAATVQCTSPCVVWSLTRHLFHSIREFVHSNTTIKRRNWLSKCPVACSFNNDQLYELLSSLEVLTFRSGDIVQEEGEIMSRIFMVERGELEIQHSTFTSNAMTEVSLSAKDLGVITSLGDQVEEDIIRRDNESSLESGPTAHNDIEEGKLFIRKGSIFGAAVLQARISPDNETPLGEVWTCNETGAIRCPVKLIAKSNVVCAFFSIDALETLQNLRNPEDISLGHTSTLHNKLKAGEFDPSVLNFISTVDKTPGELIMLAKSSTDDGKMFLVQALGKKSISERNLLEHTRNQKRIMSKLISPEIVRFCGYYQTPTAICFVEEHLGYGDLWTMIYEDTMDDMFLPPALTQFYTCCILSMLSYLHKHQITFRNLRPENLVFDSKGYLHLRDFRCAKKVPFTETDDSGLTIIRDKTHTMCGSPEYLAPEYIFCIGVDHGADIWAMGVLIYEMCVKRTPFNPGGDSNVQDIFTQIAQTKVQNNFFLQELQNYPDEKVLASKLMKNRAKSRLGYRCTENIIKHSYIADFDMSAFASGRYVPPYVPDAAVYPLSDVEAATSDISSYFETYTGDSSEFELE